MSCPAWENCQKKGCIEESVCLNGDYWSRYWQQQKNQNTTLWRDRKSQKKKRRLTENVAKRNEYFKNTPACIKSDVWCDKKESCDILGQCIVTIARIASNKPLMEALKGPHSIGGIIKILRQYDPEPMESYYFCQKRKKI